MHKPEPTAQPQTDIPEEDPVSYQSWKHSLTTAATL